VGAVHDVLIWKHAYSPFVEDANNKLFETAYKRYMLKREIGSLVGWLRTI